MVKHIVMWKYDTNIEGVKGLLYDLKEDFYNLVGKIDGLIDLEFHYNTLDSSTANMVLETIHDSKESLALYQSNPLHKAIGTKYKILLTNRSCVDYTF